MITTITPIFDDLEARRPIWAALSELFLDTELQDNDFNWMAGVLANSAYTIHEIEHILYNEVYPICIWNLRSVAGEWAGIELKWLEERIIARQQSKLKWPAEFQTSRWMISKEWEDVKSRILAIRRSGSCS